MTCMARHRPFYRPNTNRTLIGKTSEWRITKVWRGYATPPKRRKTTIWRANAICLKKIERGSCKVCRKVRDNLKLWHDMWHQDSRKVHDHLKLCCNLQQTQERNSHDILTSVRTTSAKVPQSLKAVCGNYLPFRTLRKLRQINDGHLSRLQRYKEGELTHTITTHLQILELRYYMTMTKPASDFTLHGRNKMTTIVSTSLQNLWKHLFLPSH